MVNCVLVQGGQNGYYIHQGNLTVNKKDIKVKPLFNLDKRTDKYTETVYEINEIYPD